MSAAAVTILIATAVVDDVQVNAADASVMTLEPALTFATQDTLALPNFTCLNVATTEQDVTSAEAASRTLTAEDPTEQIGDMLAAASIIEPDKP